jgi:hypothetical protein
MRERRRVGRFEAVEEPGARFRLLLAAHYLRSAGDDRRAVQLMRLIYRLIGVRAAFFTAAMERNFHAVLACKLEGIPTVGIMHGVASRYGTPYDFMPGYHGEKRLSVDRYGVWSEWWRGYYLAQSAAYAPEQLVVSGPMRPFVAEDAPAAKGPVRVLFVAEQTAVPEEVMPYLHALAARRDVTLAVKFRPFRDGFEEWLKRHEPALLSRQDISFSKGSMQEAFHEADVAVGCHSTGVLEALLAGKAPLFIRTEKWGDYYEFTKSEETRPLFAESPEELVERLMSVRTTLPRALLTELRERYFGDPHKNGSEWVVAQLQEYLARP